MKSFTEFLESHNIHLNEIDSIIREKDKKIQELIELTQENYKIYAQIMKTLEYGLKEESKLKEAVSKVIELAKDGYNLKSSDFSSWAKITGKKQ